ncbi:hypothetical protein C5167_029724 [Papaver somniferum]|nr:hypothetical protein C5167_029724 [Papaver somniferum]
MADVRGGGKGCNEGCGCVVPCPAGQSCRCETSGGGGDREQTQLRKLGGGKGCNEGCGCVVPCPGGQSCRCETSGGGDREHMKCSCGEHCGCNPCGCSEGSQGSTGVGKTHCKCGPGCGCFKCAS